MTDPDAPAGFSPPAPVIATIRFTVPEEETVAFAAGAEQALDALAGAGGFRAGRLARAVDAPDTWLLASEWDGPGAWRRALGGYQVRLALSPLLVFALDAPGAFEILVEREGPGQAPRRHGSALAPDAATAAPGH